MLLLRCEFDIIRLVKQIQPQYPSLVFAPKVISGVAPIVAPFLLSLTGSVTIQPTRSLTFVDRFGQYPPTVATFWF